MTQEEIQNRNSELKTALEYLTRAKHALDEARFHIAMAGAGDFTLKERSRIEAIEIHIAASTKRITAIIGK